MNFIFLVTDYERKLAKHTTIRLAREATSRGHQVWFTQPGSFSYDLTNRLWVEARKAPKQRYNSSDVYLKDVLTASDPERIPADQADLLFLRDNPPKQGTDRNWAQSSGVMFGRLAKENGVLVLNDPDGLSRASNKLYLQGFPANVRPKTLITRNLKEVKDFAESLKGDMILKPLAGSGGDRVFIVKKKSPYNLNQLVESLSSTGYLIAQQYLTAAKEGDVRLFLMDGEPLRVKGKYAAFRRRRTGDDIRSNMHAGGVMEAVEVDDKMLAVAEAVKPKLLADGMFLVGLDIVGNKLMEINVFCPGGLGGMEQVEGVNFSGAVIEALEKKVEQTERGPMPPILVGGVRVESPAVEGSACAAPETVSAEPSKPAPSPAPA